MKPEAVNERKSRDLSKVPRKSKKPEMFKPVNYRRSAALDFNTYRFVRRSSLYEDQVVNHVAKCASVLQVQKKAHIFDPMDPFR